MTDTQSQQLNLDPLPEIVRPAVEFLATKLIADLADNLVSLSVVGSALTADFHPRRSDINTVLIVQRRSRELLTQLAGYGTTMGKKKLRAPLLMTLEYIAQSLDVFGVEFLDFQLNHTVVYGPDPFTELAFTAENIRLQCERQLKAALIQLRQGYIQSLAKPKLVADLLTACVGELLVLLRAMLWLSDADRPTLAQATLEQAAEKFNFELAPLTQLINCKQQHTRLPADRIETTYESVYQTIDQLARRVDQLRTKA